MAKKINENEVFSDKVLIKQVLDNKRLAYEELMNRYYSPIYYMILKLVRNMSDAEELTQEVFAKVFRILDKYDERYSFRSWLFTISSNIAIDFLRKKKKNEIFVNEDVALLSKSYYDESQPTPEEDLIQKQNSNELKDRLASLRERYRRLIELRYFEEYTYEEIAEELSVPIGTVKTQLYRAKSALLKTFRTEKL